MATTLALALIGFFSNPPITFLCLVISKYFHSFSQVQIDVGLARLAIAHDLQWPLTATNRHHGTGEKITIERGSVIVIIGAGLP